MTWRGFTRGGFAWVSFWLASCGGPTFIVQQYEGPPRPVHTIAILRVNGGGPELFSIDGERLRAAPEKGTRLHVELLPGVHEVGVVAPSAGIDYGVTVRFVADAGKVYRMVVSAAPPGGGLEPVSRAFAVEVERGSDAELRPALVPLETPPPTVTKTRPREVAADGGSPPPDAADAGPG